MLPFKRFFQRDSFTLSFLFIFLLLLLGCQTAEENAESAVADPTHSQSITLTNDEPDDEEGMIVESQSVVQPAIELSSDLDLSFEIDALRQMAEITGQSVTFAPAKDADIGWLVEAGAPYDLLHYYALAEPSAPIRANDVEIYPLALLKEINETHTSVELMREKGKFIIATTIVGDFFFVDTNQAEISTVYMGSHDKLLSGISDAEYEEFSTLSAISIQQFLAKYAAGQITYDFYHPDFVAEADSGLQLYADSLETYENEELGIAVTLPVSWIVTGSFSGTGINLFGPGRDGEPFDRNQYISIERFNSARSTESLPDEFIQYFESQAEVENVQLESIGTREINGLAAEEIVFRYQISGQELVQQTVVLQQDQKTYALSLITAASQYGMPDDLSIADNILDSFMLVNPE